MARLALLAMLALVLLPSIGRIAQGFDAATAPGENALAFGAMCTAQGLAYDPTVASIEAALFSPTDNDRDPPLPHFGDCDYCTIAATSVVPAFITLAAPALADDTVRPVNLDRIAQWYYPLGLGSRGPPIHV
jgi:Protein of unknown function (DUF2946)